MDLAEYLKKNRLGVREFARLSGISPATISRIASGKPAKYLTALLIWEASKRRISKDRLLRGAE